MPEAVHSTVRTHSEGEGFITHTDCLMVSVGAAAGLSLEKGNNCLDNNGIALFVVSTHFENIISFVV